MRRNEIAKKMSQNKTQTHINENLRNSWKLVLVTKIKNKLNKNKRNKNDYQHHHNNDQEWPIKYF